MALQFAFHLGSLVFAATLIRSACEQVTFTDGITSSAILGLIFFGIGFAVGEISRHMMEELAARELAAAIELREAELSGPKSTASSTGQ